MPFVRILALALAKTLSKLFGLATITFFGRAPSRDDDKLSAVGLLSVAWLAAAVGVALPGAAEMMIPFAPDDEVVLRVIALAFVLVVPVAIGLTVSRMQNQPDDRRNTLANVGRGFVYAPVISLLVVALIVVVPVVKASYLVRRFELQHLAIMVPEGGADRLNEHLRVILAEAGIDTEPDPHPWVIRRLFAWLSWTEGHIFRRGLATRMDRLLGTMDGDSFELTLHGTDVTVLGRQDTVSCVFALIAERIDPRVAYMTWDERSQRLEDEIAGCREQIEAGEACDRERLDEIADELRHLGLEPPSWNAVRRQLYRVQVDSERLRTEGATADQRVG